MDTRTLFQHAEKGLRFVVVPEREQNESLSFVVFLPDLQKAKKPEKIGVSPTQVRIEAHDRTDPRTGKLIHVPAHWSTRMKRPDFKVGSGVMIHKYDYDKIPFHKFSESGDTPEKAIEHFRSREGRLGKVVGKEGGKWVVHFEGDDEGDEFLLTDDQLRHAEAKSKFTKPTTDNHAHLGKFHRKEGTDKNPLYIYTSHHGEEHAVSKETHAKWLQEHHEPDILSEISDQGEAFIKKVFKADAKEVMRILRKHDEHGEKKLTFEEKQILQNAIQKHREEIKKDLDELIRHHGEMHENEKYLEWESKRDDIHDEIVRAQEEIKVRAVSEVVNVDDILSKDPKQITDADGFKVFAALMNSEILIDKKVRGTAKTTLTLDEPKFKDIRAGKFNISTGLQDVIVALSNFGMRQRAHLHENGDVNAPIDPSRLSSNTEALAEHLATLKAKYDAGDKTVAQKLSATKSAFEGSKEKVALDIDKEIAERAQREQDMVHSQSVEHPLPKGFPKGTKFLGSFQQKGINYVVKSKKGYLAFTMGTGKTFMSLAAIQQLMNEKKVEGGLVIVPATVIPGWASPKSGQIAKFFGKKVAEKEVLVLPSNPQAMIAALKSPQAKKAKFIIGHYKQFSRMVPGAPDTEEVTKALKKFASKRAIVMDEMHNIKNPQSNAHVNLKDVIKEADHAWGLSGTPSPRSPMDIYHQIELLHPGALGTQQMFAAKYTGTRIKDGKQINTVENLQDLQKELAPYRMAVSENDPEVKKNFPDFREDQIVVRMEPEQAKYYNAAASGLLQALLKVKDPAHMTTEESANALALMTRMRQISFMPEAYDPKLKDVPSSKMDEVVQRIKDHWNDQPERGVGIFAYFKSAFPHMKEKLKNELGLADDEIGEIVGGMGDEKRARTIDDINSGKIKVALIGYGAGAEGLNLQENVNLAVHMNDPWNYSHRYQANKRFARPGQKHKVKSFVVHNEGTIDQYIEQIIRKKQKLHEALMGEAGVGVSEEQIAGSMTFADFVAAAGKVATKDPRIKRKLAEYEKVAGKEMREQVKKKQALRRKKLKGYNKGKEG